LKLAEKAVAALRARNAPPAVLAAVLDTLGFAQMQANLLFEAETSLKESIRTSETASAHCHLADLYLRKDRLARARQELEAAKRLARQRGDENVERVIARLASSINAPDAPARRE